MDNYFTRFFTKKEKSKDVTIIPKDIEEELQKRNVPIMASQMGRSSSPPRSVDPALSLNNSFTYVKPNFNFEAIKLIRKLRTHNPDVGLVINDMKELTNTGHRIRFSSDTPPDIATKMQKHIEEVTKTWADGVSGIDGIVNKLISQIWIGGAISGEFVPNMRMTGIKQLSLVNPEEIRIKYSKRKGRYSFYQQTLSTPFIQSGIKKLNPKQYKYFALNGDEEVPYGIPPFISALEALETQKDMKDNISYVVDQVGIMGFLEFLMEKPMQDDGESDDAYKGRLTNMLLELRTNISKGFKEGVVVGYKEDHESTFHSTSKDIKGLDSIFNLNEVQVANGLKASPSFLGIKSGEAETAMSIVFTKLISQLSNVQMNIAAFLEFGYKLELRLAGFQTKYSETTKVEFNPSTISDDLKIQQAGEIKRRNLKADYDQGIISQVTFADALGYQKPDQIEPRVQAVDPNAESSDPTKKKKREEGKDDSDRRTRDKGKSQPKRRDNDTRKP
jgi:hypothetical protein